MAQDGGRLVDQGSVPRYPRSRPTHADAMPVDPSVVRRRRAIELCALITRGLSLVGTVLYLAGWAFPAADVLPSRLMPVCFVGVVVMALAVALSWAGFRRPASRWYGPISAGQVALDTAVVVGIVCLLAGHGDDSAWAALVVPVAVAALRHRLPGALAVWAVISAAYCATVLSADTGFAAADLVYPCGVALLVALVAGTQSSALARQISDLQHVRRALDHQVNHDNLTGLPNRASLAAHAARHDGAALALALVDLDGFKQVNDTLGHAAGDVLLQRVAQRLGGTLRDGELAGRLGGDEFVVLLPGADAATCEAAARRIRDAVGEPVAIGGDVVRVGASVGYAVRPAGSTLSVEALMHEADLRMYAAKRGSRVS
ncbi:diguanylate cyclase domain-containing protein [Actinoplanes sp. CA-030573]|uniref:diguanylate cyclase domain-containing protein n=1 Tax=Actinoplanes sp. CA-030573 TaxID=3239898 RepID=UPI003D8E61BA